MPSSIAPSETQAIQPYTTTFYSKLVNDVADIAHFSYMFSCLQCFDAVGWAAEWHPACKKN